MRKLTTSDIEGLGESTRMVVAGRHPDEHFGFVNPPVVHGSTVLSPTMADLTGHTGRYSYGRRGSPTMGALEEALMALEGKESAGVVLCPSGLAAVSTALLSCLKAGDHLLMTDSVYGPTRNFCDGVLRRFGVETTYYDPQVGADIAQFLKSNTRAVFTESPGSQSFEMQDIPAIAAVAHAHGALVLTDNTWATPLFYAAHAHGADIAIQAATKYLGGHSDVMSGAVSANAAAWPALKRTWGDLGVTVAPDDVFLVLRGLRTLPLRMARHHEAGLEMARWLSGHPEVQRVLHPALPSDPGHALFLRDYRGASGLFSIVLQPGPEEAVAALLDGLALFGMGYSWGGFESLAIPFDCAPLRTATQWAPGGPTLRLHIGLEDLDDLKADLGQGLERFAAARGRA
ncbi:cystathionine beta-lyase [Chelatococcus asaccharovorans]|uniref:cystathionine beta-lyase n=1 Tax=Chelatococcus asaccharovorans TaxID=28210 RepID=UPI00224C6333|nr:putative cystathionine beta-lyase [Chelatococcus asaccharovorans]CAH1680131.1 putative cystathionine beta-lyase [Chelatococcus asaccharovorans]